MHFPQKNDLKTSFSSNHENTSDDQMIKNSENGICSSASKLFLSEATMLNFFQQKVYIDAHRCVFILVQA